ncbi:GntR family transcriptional regulator [Nonomuraea sp. SYSU D8015]|uniref:GntR family transcriptional regulator n=1 Tax=Nonomuraea sp. SYSU D8015 TaxID=2593644 RepID=UPI001CB74398|nr:winged helix-turn-helix domain-containing protein [Nonomuraea sp. SYSU D8015]
MIEWKPDIPRWRQVYEILLERIENGTYPPGSKIPGILQLQEEFGIATATSQKVLHQLRADGLTETHAGMGTFVRGRPDSKE